MRSASSAALIRSSSGIVGTTPPASSPLMICSVSESPVTNMIVHMRQRPVLPQPAASRKTIGAGHEGIHEEDVGNDLFDDIQNTAAAR